MQNSYNLLLNDTCEYQQCSSVNKYNEKIVGEKITLRCFKTTEFNNEDIYDQQRLDLSKKIFIDTSIEPKKNDKVDGLTIKKIKEVKSLTVGLIGWELLI